LGGDTEKGVQCAGDNEKAPDRATPLRGVWDRGHDNVQRDVSGLTQSVCIGRTVVYL